MSLDENEANVTQELDEMVTRYEKRKRRGTSAWKQRYYQRLRDERNDAFRATIMKRFPDPSDLRCIEIGAGRGENMQFLHDVGVPWEQISANELLSDRLAELKSRFPNVIAVEGNALDIQSGPYDVILISAVLSSILDDPFRRELATHLLGLLSPRGCILWHDFSYQNPFNKDVRGITIPELRELFQAASSIEAQKITLTPPVALLVGPLYPLLAWIPFLQSHVAATISP